MSGFISLVYALEHVAMVANAQSAEPAILLTQPQAASPVAARPAVTITLPLTLDGRYVGDIPVNFAGEAVSFPGARLIELLKSDVTPATVDALTREANAGPLSPQSASVAGLQVRYDPALQELRVVTLLAARNRRQLNISPGQGSENTPTVVPENISLFLNGALSYSHILEAARGSSNAGRQPLSGSLELGGRLLGESGIAFITRHTYDEAAAHPFRRVESQLIYDMQDDLIRVTAGDLRYRGANLQALPRMAGLSVERFYGLEPSRVFRPAGQTTFDLERPSTVQIRLNGMVFQELYLNGGRYDLRDLPLNQGSNNIELVIRDDTGREQIISQNSFFDFDLLAAGETDFSGAAGVRSAAPNGIIKYSNDWLFSGFVRHGFSNSLTAAVDVQGDQSGGTFGVSTVWASPIGNWRLQATASERKAAGFGYAAGLGYSTTGQFGRNWRWSLRADGQYVDRNYTTIGDAEIVNGDEIERVARTRVSANAQISNARISVNLSGDYEKIQNEGTRTTALAGVNYSLNPSLAVGIFGRRVRAAGQSNTGLFAQVNWTPGRNRLARATYDTARREMELNYRYSPQPYVGTTGYEIGVRRSGDADTAELSGRIAHVGNRFEATAQHSILSTANFGSSERVQLSRATVASSLVLAGGNISFSRPIREAFAIVNRHATLAGRKISVDRTDNGVRAMTDAFGSAVIPDLPTYIRTSAYVDIEDLPPGYDLGSGQFTFKAPLYAGYAVEVGSAASVSLMGRVLNRAGEPIAFIAGTMSPKNQPGAAPIPVFTNRLGRLVGLGLTSGQYVLTLNTDPVFQKDVMIEADGGNLVDIGEIRVDQR